jgi:hypothetical protein
MAPTVRGVLTCRLGLFGNFEIGGGSGNESGFDRFRGFLRELHVREGLVCVIGKVKSGVRRDGFKGLKLFYRFDGCGASPALRIEVSIGMMDPGCARAAAGERKKDGDCNERQERATPSVWFHDEQRSLRIAFAQATPGSAESGMAAANRGSCNHCPTSDRHAKRYESFRMAASSLMAPRCR